MTTRQSGQGILRGSGRQAEFSGGGSGLQSVAHWYCFNSLLVLFRVNVELPCLVSWVMSSIQIPVYSKTWGYFHRKLSGHNGHIHGCRIVSIGIRQSATILEMCIHHSQFCRLLIHLIHESLFTPAMYSATATLASLPEATAIHLIRVSRSVPRSPPGIPGSLPMELA